MDIVTYALCKKMATGKGEKGDKGDKGDRGEKGEQGLPGRDGQDGRDGNDGVTPNLQVGNVTTLPAGQNVTITQSGTKENPIFNFAIPKGDKGIYIGSKDNAPLDADIVIDHSDDGIYSNELVNTPIVNNTLTLTTHKNQTTTMQNNTTITLPTVNKFTEIHLFFNTTSELTLILPNIKWQIQPNIEANKMYEFIFTYTTEWVGGCVAYV